MRRTPQEKKALSYARDRRNAYGENDKSSRRNVRRSKRFPRRANRHREHQVFTSALGAVDTELAERTEDRLYAKAPKRWRKWPDLPLGTHVAQTLEHRAKVGMVSRDHRSVPGW